MITPASAIIHLNQLERNLSNIQSQLGDGVEIIFVIKSDAYGLGLVPVAKRAANFGLKCFAVVSLNDAKTLREAGITQDILLLVEPTESELPDLIEYSLIPTLYTADRISQLNALATQAISVHLKVNTGMNRLGCSIDDAPALYQSIQEAENLKLSGIYSHFSMVNHPFAQTQLARFQSVLDTLNPARDVIRHIGNSEAAKTLIPAHFDAVRIGLAAYENMLEIQAPVIAVRHVAKGEPVGYNCEYFAPQDTQIATVHIGYADGLPSLLQAPAHVLIHGERYPIVGPVCMDLILVDLGPSPQPIAQVGDRACILGTQGSQSISVNDWVQSSGLNPRAISHGFSIRLPRQYKD